MGTENRGKALWWVALKCTGAEQVSARWPSQWSYALRKLETLPSSLHAHVIHQSRKGLPKGSCWGTQSRRLLWASASHCGRLLLPLLLLQQGSSPNESVLQICQQWAWEASRLHPISRSHLSYLQDCLMLFSFQNPGSLSFSRHLFGIKSRSHKHIVATPAPNSS